MGSGHCKVGWGWAAPVWIRSEKLVHESYFLLLLLVLFSTTPMFFPSVGIIGINPHFISVIFSCVCQFSQSQTLGYFQSFISLGGELCVRKAVQSSSSSQAMTRKDLGWVMERKLTFSGHFAIMEKLWMLSVKVNAEESQDQWPLHWKHRVSTPGLPGKSHPVLHFWVSLNLRFRESESLRFSYCCF